MNGNNEGSFFFCLFVVFWAFTYLSLVLKVRLGMYSWLAVGWGEFNSESALPVMRLSCAMSECAYLQFDDHSLVSEGVIKYISIANTDTCL